MLLELLLRGLRREIDADGRDAHLGAIPVLPADIGMRTRIVTDEHRCQPGNDSAFTQRRNPNGETLLDRRCSRLAIQNCRGHALILAGPRRLMPSAARTPSAEPCLRRS